MTTDDELHALTGAFVLDSLPEGERLAFETHLASCAACRDEVELLRVAVPSLVTADIPPPAGLRDRIMQEAGRTPQEEPSEPRADRSPARRSEGLPWLLRLSAAAAAVLLVAVGGLSYVLVERTEELQQTRATTEQFADLLAAPDVTVSTSEGDPDTIGRVVASPSREQALVLVDRLAPAPAGRTYQLWLIAGDQTISAGLFDPDTDGRTIRSVTSGLTDVDAVGVTLEPAGGSPRPTTDPVLAIELS